MTLPWISKLDSNDEKLTSLYVMSMRKLSDDDWKDISTSLIHHNTNLRDLNVSGQVVTAESLKLLADAIVSRAVRGFPLNYLSVGHQRIGSELMTAFFGFIGAALDSADTSCPLLVNVWDLEHRSIDSECLDHLCALAKDIKSKYGIVLCNDLRLARNPIESIPQSLQDFTMITHLDISCCPISDLHQGDGLLSLVANENAKLKNLVMWDCSIGGASLQLLATRMVSLESFYFSPPLDIAGPCVGASFFACLPRNSPLDDIRFKRCSLTVEGASSVSEALATIVATKLELSECLINSEVVKSLSASQVGFPQLEKLDLTKNAIDGDGLALLMSAASFPKLKQLTLLGNKLECPPLIEDFNAFPVLEVVDISCNPLSVDFIRQSRTLFPQVSQILIGGIPHHEDHADEYARAIEDLEKSLDNCTLGR